MATPHLIIANMIIIHYNFLFVFIALSPLWK